MSKTQKLPARFAEAVERLDGDEGLLRKMAAITAADLPEAITETEHAIRDGDVRQAASGLHKLKGMLSTFETSGVAIQIHDMLDLARKGKDSLLRQEYNARKAEIKELASAIASIAST